MTITRVALTATLAAGMLASPAFAQQQLQGQDLPPPDVTEHQDWSVACRDLDTGRACEMLQTVNERESGQPFMQIRVAYPRQAEAPILQIAVPLGALLPAGLHIAIDGEDIGSLPFAYCTSDGCFAQTDLAEETLARLRGGTNGTVTFAFVTGQEPEVPFSLMGFTASYNEVRQARG